MRKYIKTLILVLLIYTGLTCLIYRFTHPSLTETQIFLAIPKAFILDFK